MDVKITVLAVGGTGESSPQDTSTRVSGLLAGVTDQLDSRFASRWVPYPASYGPAPSADGMSYRESVELGVAHLRATIAATAGPLMLIGYSQGAVVIRELLAQVPFPGSQRVRGVGFVADPHQPPGVVPGCDGWGVAGEGPALPEWIPAFWVGTPDDMICNARPDSLVRDIADLTGDLSLPRLRRWPASALAAVRSGRLQNAARTRFGARQWVRDVERLREAYDDVRRYLPQLLTVGSRRVRNPEGGRHTSYGHEPYLRAPLTDPDSTGVQALAAWLQVRATALAASGELPGTVVA